MIASYQSSRASRAAVNNATPPQALYGKEANLGTFGPSELARLLAWRPTPRTWMIVPRKYAWSAKAWTSRLFASSIHVRRRGRPKRRVHRHAVRHAYAGRGE